MTPISRFTYRNWLIALHDLLATAAAVVLTAKTNVRLKHIEFVRLEPERALVILVAEDGQVENRVLNVSAGLPTSALIEAANFLNHHFAGQDFGRIRLSLAEELKKHPNEIRDGEAWKNKFIADNLPPEIAKRMGGVSNFGFHYLGAAKIIALIGKAFAQAMVDLLKTHQEH